MTEKFYSKGFFGIYLIIGLVWLRSSFEKISSGQFASSLGGILLKVADKNPYPWYKSFLLHTAIPNAQLFGLLTMWGEFLTAVSIILGSYLALSKSKLKVAPFILLAGLIGGMFLNLTFWLGFGYTSPSADSLNILMFLIELIGVTVLIKVLQNK